MIVRELESITFADAGCEYLSCKGDKSADKEAVRIASQLEIANGATKEKRGGEGGFFCEWGCVRLFAVPYNSDFLAPRNGGCMARRLPEQSTGDVAVVKEWKRRLSMQGIDRWSNLNCQD